MSRRLAAALMVAYLAVFFGLTLGGFYQPRPPINLEPFRTIRHDFGKGGHEFVVNVLGNLAAGLPMGLLLPALLGRACSARRVASSTLAVSLLIEVLQGISGRRVADVDDLILNTLGGLMGYGCRLAVALARSWRAQKA